MRGHEHARAGTHPKMDWRTASTEGQIKRGRRGTARSRRGRTSWLAVPAAPPLFLLPPPLPPPPRFVGAAVSGARAFANGIEEERLGTQNAYSAATCRRQLDCATKRWQDDPQCSYP